MKTDYLILTLIALFAFSLGCAGCEEEPKNELPKLVEKKEVPIEPKVDPLKEATEEAERVAMDDSVYISDRAREVAAEIEAQSHKTVSKRPPKEKPEPETGSLAKSELRKVFNVHAGAMRKCYERQLKRNPRLEGKVRLEIVIRSSGQVGSAKVNGISLDNRQVNDCMVRQARTMKFPKPDGGAARVTMPYTFTPEI